MSGWIKLHRSISQSWVWDDKPYTKGQAWVDILIMVNHADAKTLIGNEIVDIERGQKPWSILEMAKRWGWSRKKVSNFLNRLEADSMLVQNRTSKYTMITVVNYDLYQGEEHQENIERTSKEHQKNTNKNDKNNKNNNIYCTFFEKMWSLYPNKVGKGKVSVSKKKEVNKLGDEFERCIERYIKHVDVRRKTGFPELKYQNGSTFFNSGYVDYLDKNYEEQKQPKTWGW